MYIQGVRTFVRTLARRFARPSPREVGGEAYSTPPRHRPSLHRSVSWHRGMCLKVGQRPVFPRVAAENRALAVLACTAEQLYQSGKNVNGEEVQNEWLVE